MAADDAGIGVGDIETGGTVVDVGAITVATVGVGEGRALVGLGGSAVGLGDGSTTGWADVVAAVCACPQPTTAAHKRKSPIKRINPRRF